MVYITKTVTPVHIREMLEAPEGGRLLVEDQEVGTIVISGSIKSFYKDVLKNQ